MQHPPSASTVGTPTVGSISVHQMAESEASAAVAPAAASATPQMNVPIFIRMKNRLGLDGRSSQAVEAEVNASVAEAFAPEGKDSMDEETVQKRRQHRQGRLLTRRKQELKRHKRQASKLRVSATRSARKRKAEEALERMVDEYSEGYADYLDALEAGELEVKSLDKEELEEEKAKAADGRGGVLQSKTEVSPVSTRSRRVVPRSRRAATSSSSSSSSSSGNGGGKDGDDEQGEGSGEHDPANEVAHVGGARVTGLQLALDYWMQTKMEDRIGVVNARKKRKKQSSTTADLSQSLKLDLLDAAIKNTELCEDGRFTAGRHLVDQVDVGVTMVLNLYPGGFSIDNQRMYYTYDSPYRVLLQAIDTGRLTSDVRDMLKNTPCLYHDGCLVVDIHDYRYNNSPTSAPTVQRVLLRPDPTYVAADVTECWEDHRDELGGGFNQQDIELEVEKRILLATREVDTNPSQHVLRVANAQQYNALKFNRACKPRVKKPSVPSTIQRKVVQMNKEVHHRVTYNYVTNKTAFGLLSFLRERKEEEERRNKRREAIMRPAAGAPAMPLSVITTSTRAGTTLSQLPNIMTPNPMQLAKQLGQVASNLTPRKLAFGVPGASASGLSIVERQAQQKQMMRHTSIASLGDGMDLEEQSEDALGSSSSSSSSEANNESNTSASTNTKHEKHRGVMTGSTEQQEAQKASIPVENVPSHWALHRVLRFESLSKRGHQVCYMDVYRWDTETLGIIRVQQLTTRGHASKSTMESARDSTKGMQNAVADVGSRVNLSIPTDAMCFGLGPTGRHKAFIQQFIDLFSREGFMLVADSHTGLDTELPVSSSNNSSISSRRMMKRMQKPSLSAKQMMEVFSTE